MLNAVYKICSACLCRPASPTFVFLATGERGKALKLAQQPQIPLVWSVKMFGKFFNSI